MNHFDDKVALVAGGTGALGREVCIALLGAGARVITTYRQQQEFQNLIADAPSARGGKRGTLTGVDADTTDPTSVAALVNEHMRAGNIDILVNAVGSYAGGKNVWEEDFATYERMLALNLKSGFVLARAVLPGMIRQNRGWIVNVASRAGYGHSAGAALY